MGSLVTVLLTIVVAVVATWVGLLVLALFFSMMGLRFGCAGPDSGDGIRTLDDAAASIRASGQQGWALVEGGLAVDIAELSSWPMGAWWGPDGKIYLGSGTGGIRCAPVEGGTVRGISTVDRSRETGHRLPSVLPGGRTLLSRRCRPCST